MKYIVLIGLISGIMALCACTTEKTPAPQQQIPAITLSLADKEKLQAFQQEVLNIENLTDKAVKLAVDELKNVIKGGEVSINVSSVIDKAKAECLLAGEALSKKAIPEALPPEAKSFVNEGKTGLIAAYKAYAESFDAIKSFITDKNPMALLEYRKKNSQAQELYNGAADKLKKVMTAAGVTQM
jgi:broad specificity polyphosphatase/5'/3'-nucleotidase SurE